MQELLDAEAPMREPAAVPKNIALHGYPSAGIGCQCHLKKGLP